MPTVVVGVLPTGGVLTGVVPGPEGAVTVGLLNVTEGTPVLNAVENPTVGTTLSVLGGRLSPPEGRLENTGEGMLIPSSWQSS